MTALIAFFLAMNIARTYLGLFLAGTRAGEAAPLRPS
jgi:hypothetical protein